MNVAQLNIPQIEKRAIAAFSERVKEALGPDLVSILLFGSKARGDYQAGSDIDVFMLIKNERENADSIIAQITADVLDEFEILISPVSYSLFEHQKNVELGSFFFEAVEKEGITL